MTGALRFLRSTFPIALAVIASGEVAAQQVADPAMVIARAAQADIVVLGEMHDNPAHHAFQAAIVDALSPTALVFEMLTVEEAARVTADLASMPGKLAETLDWANSGWPDFDMYYPLIAFAARGPILGAEITRDMAQGAFAGEAAAVFADTFGADPQRYGLTDPLPDEEQALREAEQNAAHCDALPPEILPGFVAAQRLRDTALAHQALTALERHGGPVVVITGNGHARTDRAVPRLVAEAAPEVRVLALGQFEATPTAPVPFDLWTITEAMERGDPCAAFR